MPRQLAQDLVRRIPAHTPEWRNPRLGDPGRTLIDLFAWLGDTLLYRVNLIPERQRLAFLRLLGMPAAAGATGNGAGPARHGEPRPDRPVPVPRGTPVVGPCRSRPSAKSPCCRSKAASITSGGRPTTSATPERGADRPRAIYGITRRQPYVTTPVFADGRAEPAASTCSPRASTRRCGSRSSRATPDDRAGGAARLRAGAGDPQHRRRAAPGRARSRPERAAARAAAAAVGVGDHERAAGAVRRGRLPHARGRARRYPGLRAGGRAAAAAAAGIRHRLPPNDVDDDVRAGVGDRPPRLDDPDAAARLLAWLRLRPVGSGSALPLSWVGINAVEIDQRKTLRDTVVGAATGAADQVVQLPATSIDPDSLALEVQRGRPRLRRLAAGRRSRRLRPGRPRLRARRGSRHGALRRWRARPRGRSGRARPRRQAARRRRPRRQPAARQARRDRAPAPRLRAAGAGDRRRGRRDAAGGRAPHPQVLRHAERAVTVDDYKALAFETPGVASGASRCCRASARSSGASTARAR